ncbi:MAG: ribosome silencing factor [Calditrichaeota bacterium]|nr:MAG: ribosome silencing factor [Calditrichota bacterium]
MIELNTSDTAKLAAQFALDKKANDIKILDLRPLTTVTDFFVICSADSTTQVKAIAENVADQLKFEYGENPINIEGFNNLTWVLLDYVDFVVHIFQKDQREFFSLERLWQDAPTQIITDESLKDEE